MQYNVDDNERKQAKTPHELFMVNLVAFHLLLTPAAIVLGLGGYSLLLLLACSGSIIGYIYLRARRLAPGSSWYVFMHWRLAFKRAKLLLIAYAITGAILLTGLLITTGIERHTTQEIVFTIFSRIGIMPVFVMVLITFVLESGSIYQAGIGVVPDDLIGRFPPPPELEVVEGAPEPGSGAGTA